MSAFLQNLIPSSNRVEAAFASGTARQTLLEDSYDSGFVGAFGDSDDHPEWAKRARAYLRDEFLHDTDGPHLFSEVCGSLATGDGECHMNQADALRAWEAAGKIGVKPFNTFQDYGSCFPAGTRIRMADGSCKAIEDVRLLDKVVTAEGNVGDVMNCMVRFSSEPLHVIKLWGHYGIRCTAEHPILTSRGYVKACDIKIGDEVSISRAAPQHRTTCIQTELHSSRMASPYAANYKKDSYRSVGSGDGRRLIRVCNNVPDIISLDFRFGRLLGLFLAEGNCDFGKVVWTFSADEADTIVAECVSLIRDVFGIEAIVSRPKQSTIKVTVHSRPLSEVLTSLCGNGAGVKRLHPDISSGPDEFRSAMLYGWLSGDGYDRGFNVLQGVTISRSLALDMFSIGSSLGLNPTVRYGEPKVIHNVKSRQPRFDVYFLKEQKGGSWQSRHTDTESWRLVRAVEQIEFDGPVYNLSVLGDQSYVADEIGVHNCVDASFAEMVTSLIGYRIARPEFNERWVSSVAWYQYADRGYCSDGWDGYGIATVAKRNGIAFRLPYEISGNKVDFTDDDRNEQIVARTWCRTGIPTWLREFTRVNHAFDDDAITQFDGGLPELKQLFAAGGCLHFSGTRTSGSNKPFVWGSTGPHMMSAYGYDDSDDYRRFCRDVLGISERVNDFPVQCGQTWGPNWRGEIADQYWPSWWGPKPEGAWVCWASEFVQRLSLDVAYLPKVKGFPGQGPQPEPDYPPIEGTLHGETVNGRIAIRGELKAGGKPYIVVPNGTGAFKVVPKPVL